MSKCEHFVATLILHAIIIDLTKYVPQKENSPESEWINLFKTMSDAKRVPKGKDEIICDAYERSRVSKATRKYIKKVAAYMVTKEEIRTRRVSCKIACELT